MTHHALDGLPKTARDAHDWIVSHRVPHWQLFSLYARQPYVTGTAHHVLRQMMDYCGPTSDTGYSNVVFVGADTLGEIIGSRSTVDRALKELVASGELLLLGNENRGGRGRKAVNRYALLFPHRAELDATLPVVNYVPAAVSPIVETYTEINLAKEEVSMPAPLNGNDAVKAVDALHAGIIDEAQAAYLAGYKSMTARNGVELAEPLDWRGSGRMAFRTTLARELLSDRTRRACAASDRFDVRTIVVTTARRLGAGQAGEPKPHYIGAQLFQAIEGATDGSRNPDGSVPERRANGRKPRISVASDFAHTAN